ncbi:MAG: hypothetical protein QOE53_57 [Pseudonocardiales bacterium]|jgi:hypothetical protein|nr:hypothetical protein [Pseudonocardiales bacterium]
MRVLAMTVLTALAITGCASTQSAGGPGSGRASVTPGAPTGGAGATGGSAGTGSGRPTATPSGSPVDARCPAQLDEGQYNGRQAKPIPSGLAVDWVLRCRVAPQPDGSRFLLVERSDSDPAALLAALRASDEPRSSGACPMIRMVLPYFALVQPGGTTLAPKVPLTGCGMPQAALVQALNGMRFQVISRKQLP